MVKIRLRRIGKKGQPSYRVVVTDARSPRDGRFIENIGSYDPMREPSFVEIDGFREPVASTLLAARFRLRDRQHEDSSEESQEREIRRRTVDPDSPASGKSCR